jgi:hypothetical protein
MHVVANIDTLVISTIYSLNSRNYIFSQVLGVVWILGLNFGLCRIKEKILVLNEI